MDLLDHQEKWERKEIEACQEIREYKAPKEMVVFPAPPARLVHLDSPGCLVQSVRKDLKETREPSV